MPRRRLRWILVWLISALTISVVSAQPAQRAGLIVRYGDGSVATACVTFSEPQISGLELLQRSGLPLIVQQMGLGAAVCKIGNDGCDYPTTGCFCARDGARAVYWAFSTRRAGSSGWEYAPLGAQSVTVQDGDIHGWAWGAGDASSGAQPPLLSLAEICTAGTVGAPATAVPTAPATAVPTAPATAVPTAPATAVPTAPAATPPMEPSATDVPSPTTSVAVAAGVRPTVTVTAVAADRAAGQASAAPASWLIYGAMAFVLGGGMFMAVRRRRRQGQS